ncbi:MAG: carbon-nitrogen hydrolase family protein [Rubrimonas sp.]|uniref:carbon-nitrogen hydrolase family protein n=1 Tax=Rubrimonas sp. TaxID=2036015 RepID=UPI002FDE04F4
MRAGLVQLTASDDPEANLPATEALIRKAAAGGAQLVLTPEVTNIVTSDADRRRALLRLEQDDPTLARLRAVAAELEIWLLIGSLALRTGDPDGRFANRSLLIDAQGAIRARYDKIHMFDVDVSETETWRESAAFRPGDRAVLAPTPWCGLGMTICYDLRFPALHRALAQAGASILTVPAAFTPPTGEAHWEVLLRARAVETGCFVLAPAQCGAHPRADGGAPRRTWGHSLAVAPWGEVLADGREAPGATLVDLDLSQVEAARRRIPALRHDRDFTGP